MEPMAICVQNILPDSGVPALSHSSPSHVIHGLLQHLMSIQL